MGGIEMDNKLMYAQNKKWMEVEDIFANILSRLPIKSLMIYKSVCKYWRGFISSPSFILFHLSKSKENPNYIAYPCAEDGLKTHLMKFDENIFEKLPFPGCGKIYNDKICSFNGLICWSRCYNWHMPDALVDIYIYNPATGEDVLLLPNAPHHKNPARIGVAVGPQISEYKVYGFFGKSQDKFIECEVYSSMTKSWKGIGLVSQYPLSSEHISIKGVVYWFMCSKIDSSTPDSILAIDMEENFSRISLPREVKAEDLFFVDFEGCLSLISSHADVNRFDLWILKDGDESIWVKKCSDTIPIIEYGNIFSVAARKNEILFILKEKRCLVYGVDNKTLRELNCVGVFWSSIPSVFTFTESILPCGGLID